MALAYGNTFTASDMKSLLEKNDKRQSGIRTWRQLFGNAALGFNAQSDALKTDYASAISEAYAANFKQNNAIMSAGLNIGATQDLLSQNRNDLHTAYQTYVQNYNSDLNTAMTNYQTEYTAIDEDLTDRAQKFADLYNSAYKYLSEELSGAYTNWTSSEKYMQYLEDALASGALTADQVAAYMGTNQLTNRDYLTTYGLSNFMTVDADGNRTIKPWSQVSQSLFNDDGSLNMTGVEFFDQIFNATPQGYFVNDEDGNTRSARSFDQWLSDTNSELRDWYVSSDNYNYNLAGTNRGTANVLSGRESTDYKYHQSEYTTETDIDNLQVDTYTTPAEYNNLNNEYNFAYNNYEKVMDAQKMGAQYYSYRDEYGTWVNTTISDAQSYFSGRMKYAADKKASYVSSQIDSLHSDLEVYERTISNMIGSENYSIIKESDEYKNAMNDFEKLTTKDRDEFEKLTTEDRDEFEKLRTEDRMETVNATYKKLIEVIKNLAKTNLGSKKTSGF